MPENTQREWPRIGSLCSGYGGLDLAVEAVFGGRTVWHAENAAAPAKILAERWPGVPNYGDISEVAWSAPRVDVLTAGYPCQPFSYSGLRKGEADERHLWPIVAETVRRLRPGHVILENVPGHRSMGFGRVLADLASMRYVGSWVSLRASDVGAPHGRERVFILARDTDRVAWAPPVSFGRGRGAVGESGTVERTVRPARLPATDPGGARLGQHPGAAPTEEPWTVSGDESASDRGSRAAAIWGPYKPVIERWAAILGRVAPPPRETLSTGHEALSPRFVEWMQGLPAGWVCDVEIGRDAQLTALGNGVVPQQATQALRRLLAAESSLGAVS